MLPLFALVLPVIILFCGLCLDVGLIELKTLQLQSAADAAAIGAELEAERGTGNWVAQGQNDAALNGFTNGQNKVTVTVVEKATYGAYAGHYDAIQATVTQTVNTIFMGTLNGGSMTLSAQGVALMTPCVYLTGTGALQQYSLDVATGSLNGQSCPVYMNTSMRVQANGKMAVEAINVTGAASGSVLAGSVVYPSPYFNVPAMTDPLATVTQPPYTGCVHDSPGYTVSNNSNATLSPSSYCNGLTFTNSTVTLLPGTYFITGIVTWTNSIVSGTGVTLFFTHDKYNAYRGLQVSNSTVTLSAPTDVSNPYQGIVVFTDRAWVPYNPPQDFTLYHSNVTTDGIWYLTGTGLSVSSCLPATAPNCNLTGNNYFGVIADNMLLNGTIFTPLNNYSNLSTGNTFRLLSPLAQ